MFGAPRLVAGPRRGRSMRRILGRVFAMGLALAAPVSAQAAVESAPSLERIAIVDVQRVLTETTEGKRELDKIRKAFAKAEARLEKKARAVDKQLRDLQSKAAMLNEAELGRRQEEIMRAQQELQSLAMELQQEVMDQEALATERIYKKVEALVRQIALEEQIQVVLVKSQMTVLYSNPKLDLTNRIIVRYDKAHQ